MNSGVAGDVRPLLSGTFLLPKDRSILEREYMEFRPFGVDEHGDKIRDVAGMSIRATAIFLESCVAHQMGEAAGSRAVQDLCTVLNQRIKDPVYHVTPAFLKNAWNSYSNEFTAYLYEFCERISGDPSFVFRGGMEKASPIMQVLARPFSLSQIYGMFPYFGNKFASGSIECRVVEVTRRSATLAMRFAERTLRQYGPYRRRCTYLMCQAAQGIMAAVPARVHGLPPATLIETSCIANDDAWCQWDITWNSEPSFGLIRRMWRVGGFSDRNAADQIEARPAGILSSRIDQLFPQMEPLANSLGREEASDRGRTPGSGLLSPLKDPAQRHALHPSLRGHLSGYLWGGAFGFLIAVVMRASFPGMSAGEVVLAGLMPVLYAGVWINWRLRRDGQQREALIHEQIQFVESRHEELREAYLEQEQTRVQLRRTVQHLTVLHQAGLLFSSTLHREELLKKVLKTLTRDLHYDRAIISFFDPIRQVATDARVDGVSPSIRKFAKKLEIPVTDPLSPEGMVLLQGKPLLISDVKAVWDRLHPHNRKLALLTGTKALMVVPLKTKDRIIGSMIVDRRRERSLTEDDLELMITFAHQVAIALDNTSAYQQIEELNVGLEAKVRERTAELEQADRLRSQFMSHVSHELKTPLTSIKGFLQNMLDGLTGAVNEKQQRYLSRMLDNSERLIRMIEDLLDRTRIQTGKLELAPAELDLGACVSEVVEQLRPLGQVKRQQLVCLYPDQPLLVWADRDRLFQIVINLVHNAMKFTPEQGSITVAVKQDGVRHAGVSVQDTGPGIPAEFIEKIFDPFFRIKQARTGIKGLGLGLSIVRTLVELHGGTIRAHSSAGEGAELYFTLPLRVSTEPSVKIETGRTPRILVVDDDSDIRELLKDRLGAMGYEVQTEADGLPALEAFRSGLFSGMILDIGLPSLDGMEVLSRIRQEDQRVPIVVVTASEAKENAVRAIGKGAQAYLLKPFDVDELQRVVESWFRTG
ncbi:ATP-binding protein [Petrachloros mirabilis]